MSGRSRVTLADGRRVTGFRKTLRRNVRANGPRPEWRLVLILPAALAAFTAPGRHHVGIAVVSGDDGAVLLEATAWSADEAVHRAGDFLLEIGAERAPMSILATITRSDWPAGMKTTRWITVGGDIVATRSMAKPLVLKARP